MIHGINAVMNIPNANAVIFVSKTVEDKSDITAPIGGVTYPKPAAASPTKTLPNAPKALSNIVSNEKTELLISG